jgi:uncharacterized membrane protein
VIGRYWLPALMALLVLVLAGGVAAPLLAALGFVDAADGVYRLYALTCHQWAFRSFFLMGEQAVYARAQLEALGVDPYHAVGESGLGWKMAFCERDLAIYAGLLGAGVWFARHRNIAPLGLGMYALLCVPMAIDAGTQFLGARESTWELRIATGLLFGVASAWLLYPRIDTFLGVEPPVARYAADTACAPLPPRG